MKLRGRPIGMDNKPQLTDVNVAIEILAEEIEDFIDENVISRSVPSSIIQSNITKIEEL